MRIIDRYIIHEIVKPLVVICAILLGIFVSYITAEFLADAASGLLPAGIILHLILLKVLVSLEFLLPTTLFFSVVIALGRLYTDTEMTALFACGVSLNRVIKVVFSLSLFVAALVAGLSLYIRPWAYDTFYRMRDRAMAEFDLGKMEGGNFYEIPLEGRIFFAEAVDPDRNRATGVFLETARGGRVQVISAKELYQKESGGSDRPVLVFEDGYLYEFPREGAGGHIVHFRESTFALEQKEARPLKYRVRAAPTRQLYLSVDPPDVAEGQWRLTAPLSSVLLALLAIPLSRAAPRQGKYAKVVVAVVSYALYYNLSAMAKALVETGVVSRVPGIWWVPALLAGLVLALLWRHLLEYLPWKGLLPHPPDRSSSRGGL